MFDIDGYLHSSPKGLLHRALDRTYQWVIHVAIAASNIATLRESIKFILFLLINNV